MASSITHNPYSIKKLLGLASYASVNMRVRPHYDCSVHRARRLDRARVLLRPAGALERPIIHGACPHYQPD